MPHSLLFLLLFLPLTVSAADDAALEGIALSGEAGSYTVRPGDNLTLIGARLGTSLVQLQRDNLQQDFNKLRPGQVLAYDNRHIVPPAPVLEGDAVLVNLPQRMLFHYRDGRLRAAYPVAVGKRSWRTPVTETRIVSREKDKPWIVPVSIQREMRAKGERVLTRVEPGPDNPLGRYWLGLALPGYGIHGTNAPASVYGARTHGCMRMQPEHIEELFAQVGIGTPVRTIYAPVLLYLPPDGPIWLEAHPDVYGRGLDYYRLLQRAAAVAGITERIDLAAAQSLLAARAGLAADVAVRRMDRPSTLAPATEATGSGIADTKDAPNTLNAGPGLPGLPERANDDDFPPHPAGCFPGRDRCLAAADVLACR